MSRRTVTIRDVARKAGVSPATVSYVVSNRNRDGEETRRRVVQVMEDLSYYPSAHARNLGPRRTNLMGLLIPYRPDSVFLDPYFAELIRGVAMMADSLAYSPVIAAIDGDAHAHAHEVYGRIVRNDLVDGVVMTHLSDEDAYLFDEMVDDAVPFVVIGSAGNRDDTFVDVDNRGGVEQAVVHLAGLGHRTTGFIGGPSNSAHAVQRMEGFERAVPNAGLSMDACPAVNGNFTREGGRAARAHLLDRRPPPSAVFAASDLMAIGAIQCLHECGLRIPTDISVKSFNDTILATAT